MSLDQDNCSVISNGIMKDFADCAVCGGVQVI